MISTTQPGLPIPTTSSGRSGPPLQDAPPAIGLPPGDSLEVTHGGQRCVVHVADAQQKLLELPKNQFQTVVTSPPYWNLRDYGAAGQMGDEPSFGAYVASLVDLCDKVYPLLKQDGTLWVNLGDIYAGTQKLAHRVADSSTSYHPSKGTRAPLEGGCKNKDLMMLPAQVAMALRRQGWYLRSEIIWNKTNGRPESVQDRPNKLHEQLYLFSKSPVYYYRAGANRLSVDGLLSLRRDTAADVEPSMPTARDTCVWNVATEAADAAGHSAAFPRELVRRCLEATTRPGDQVLDPFFGSGTTGEVALALGRSCVGIEINPVHLDRVRQRLEAPTLGARSVRRGAISLEEKASAALQVMMGQSIACRANMLNTTQGEVLSWMKLFVQAGYEALRAAPRRAAVETAEDARSLHEDSPPLSLALRVAKRRRSVAEELLPSSPMTGWGAKRRRSAPPPQKSVAPARNLAQ